MPDKLTVDTSAGPLSLDKLLENTPEAFRPVVVQYGPALAKMTIDQFWSWVELLIQGKTQDAWDQVYGKMSGQESTDAGSALVSAWKTANSENAARINLVREAATAVLKVLLTVALTAVGL